MKPDKHKSNTQNNIIFMRPIFKTWKKGTYFQNTFTLVDNKNRAHPINFPTVFTTYGPAIKSGNRYSCTAINTPEYVITEYFDTIGNNPHDEMFNLWQLCKKLELLTWNDIDNDKEKVLTLINMANNELLKLKQL